MTARNKVLFSLGFVLVLFAFYSFELPEHWFIAGSEPKSYDMGIDKGAGQDGKNAATIKSNTSKVKGFGTLMQNCSPESFLGKRIRMSGFMKSIDVDDKAGLWLRVDQANSEKPLAFDNMLSRPVTGTTAWKNYEIVLDVPSNATNLAYGALLVGTGQIWFDKLKFEIVDQSVPTTVMGKADRMPLPKPLNLDFDN
ncbi:MAG: hypothetical protein EYC69_12430 [Bacteroidetes bacterium]|nr:MAG: hypothetical protein EYC69_12430 [Bacteroidota bacterium]